MKKFSLPNMEHSFSIQVVGKESGLNWVGDFKYRRPTLLERSQIDVFRAKLNGDLLTINQDTADFNESLAHLRFTLKEYPDWWKEADMGGSLYDYNVMSEIYTSVTKFEADWRKKVLGGNAEDVEVKDGKEPKTPIATQSK